MNRGLYVPINTTGNVGTTELEARLALSALFEHNAAGIPRSGLLIPAGSSQTIVVTGNANMSYTLAAVHPVINTAANDGVYSFTSTGTTNVVTTAAPATNSRIDLLYVKQNDKSKGDPDNLAVFGVVQGVSATSPVAPALPARALEVARATILSTTTATNTAAITQTFTYTALKGTPIPVHNTTDRATIATPAVGQEVARLDLDANGRATERWTGAAWTAKPRPPRNVVGDASVLLGSPPAGFAAKIASGEIELIHVFGSFVVTTDADGYFAINYPQAFPAGVITAAATVGDSSTGRSDIYSTAGVPKVQTLSAFWGSITFGSGAARGNTTFRVNLDAWGW